MAYHPNQAHQYCRHLLRQADFNRYIASLFAPAKKRSALIAIWAFHCEMAHLVEHVQQPLMGEIRLRWWCDALEEVDNNQSEQNPLLFALKQTILQFNLPKDRLISCLEARMRWLYNQSSPSAQELELFGRETAEVFFSLACQILASEKVSLAAPAAFHAGQIETLWRHWHGQNCQEMSVEQNVSLIISLRNHYGLFVREMAALPRILRPAFLPLAPVGHTLRLIHKGTHLLSKKTLLRPLWQISYIALTGYFIQP